MKEGHSTLNYWLEILKKLSLVTSIFTGIGLVLLYFLGIAIYNTYLSMSGVPPFDFSLQKCLEFGGNCVITLMTILPAILLGGIVDFFKEAALSWHIVLGLPLIMFMVLFFIKKPDVTWQLRVQKSVNCVLLIYIGVFLVILYMTLMSSYQTQHLFLNPDINTLIEHRNEYLKNTALNKIGLPDMDYWTANIVMHDANWNIKKIGSMYILVGLFLLYAIFSMRSSGILIDWLIERNHPFPKSLVWLRRGFFGVFAVFVISILFVVPARTVTVSNLTSNRPKIDVEIKGLESVTSKYYLMVIGDYDQRYAFYLPNKQEVIVVQKDKIGSITMMEPISLFADRHYFIKAEPVDPKK